VVADSNSIANNKGMNGGVFGVAMFAPCLPIDVHGLVVVGNSSHSASARKACAVLM
jgi:hypothetical protein